MMVSLLSRYGPARWRVQGSKSFTSAGDADSSQAPDGTFIRLAFIDNMTDQNLLVLPTLQGNTGGLLMATLEQTTIANNGTVTTTKLTDREIRFSSTLGNLDPASGLVATGGSGSGNDGLAFVDLNAGTVAGAGTVTVSFGGVTSSVNFVTEGNGVATGLTVSLVDGANTPITNISGAVPGKLRVVLTDSLGVGVK